MSPRIILITGANRGIGYCIAQALGTRAPTEIILLLASRSKASAEEAIAKLRSEAGVKAPMHALQLDVLDQATIDAAREWVSKEFGRLDVLVNNAGIAIRPSTDSWETYRVAFQNIFETNITAVGWLCAVLNPLLRKSTCPKVINVSSGVGSMSRSSNKQLPPTAVVPYSISKVGLNALTLELIKGEDVEGADAEDMEQRIEFYAVNPGYCKTAFNGFRGTKDPLDGAKVAVELALAQKGEFEPGFWEFEAEGMKEVPW